MTKKTISSEFVREWFQEVIDDLTNNLATMRDSKGQNRYASGMTAQRIGEYNQIGVYVTPDKILVELAMPDYYKFIEEGVRGAESVKPNTSMSPFQFKNRKPPITDIRQWMRSRAIVPSVNTEKARNSLAWAIAEGIRKKGIESVPFYSDVVNDERIQILEEKFLSLFGEETLDKLEFEFKD